MTPSEIAREVAQKKAAVEEAKQKKAVLDKELATSQFRQSMDEAEEKSEVILDPPHSTEHYCMSSSKCSHALWIPAMQQPCVRAPALFMSLPTRRPRGGTLFALSLPPDGHACSAVAYAWELLHHCRRAGPTHIAEAQAGFDGGSSYLCHAP